MGSAGSTSHAFLKTPCFQLSVLPNIGFQLSVARRPSLVARRSSSLVARRLFENSNLTAKKNVTCIRITPGQALS